MMGMLQAWAEGSQAERRQGAETAKEVVEQQEEGPDPAEKSVLDRSKLHGEGPRRHTKVRPNCA